MTVSLTDARTRDASRATDPLRVIAGPKQCKNGPTLAVCEDASGTLVLARKSTTGKRKGTLKRTARVADFAHALDAGIIGS